MTPAPTAQDVRDFLGRGADELPDSLAQAHLDTITSLARGYTRGNGFDYGGVPADDLIAVILTATARMLANPDQLPYDAGSVSIRGAFTGWTLAETIVLNRYRKRAL